MNRVDFIKEALDVNITQALIVSELIKPIQDSELVPFFAFRANFIQPKQSVELITKNAVFAYRKERALSLIKSGDFRFKSIKQLSEFVQTFFKNQRLCYGVADFKDFVIISVDENGNLFNNYSLKRLTSADEMAVYEWLLQNQERIGDIKFINQKKDEAQEVKKEMNKADDEISKQLFKDPDTPVRANKEAFARLGAGLNKSFKRIGA